ncbi:MAG: M12 family metallo-peptidase [Planctomycetota bacterium]
MTHRFSQLAFAAFTAAAAFPVLADRGIALQPSDANSSGFTIDLDALAQDEIEFNLPGGERVVGFISDRIAHENGNLSWQGIIPEAQDGWFSIAAANGVAHGYVDAGGVGVYELKSRGDDAGLYDAVRTDTMVFPPCSGPVIPPVEGRGIPGALEHAMIAEAGSDTGDDAQASRGGVTTIDVMIVWSAEARQGEGGTNGITALAQNSINVSNIAYANSEVSDVELRLVHFEEVVYSETDNSGTDLNNLRGTSDGFMDGIHATRDAVAADLVALLVDDMGPACGIAYLSPFNPNFGFSVTDADCAVGNLSFPHEIGHNQGATHDVENAGGAVFDYGYGWRWFGTNSTRYRSVMAYSPGSRVRQFSNPDVNYVGTPTGTATANNARVIRETAASVASFREALDPLTFTFPNGLPADLVEGESTTIAIDIDPGTDGPLDPSSAILFYGYDVSVVPTGFAPLVNTTGQTWEAQLPPGVCGQTASFYVTISNTSQEMFSAPSDPTAPFTAVVTDCVDPCSVADTNGDGALTPGDFNAWVLAFNSGAAECDQNGDGQCNPGDFNAWVLNYNAGC